MSYRSCPSCGFLVGEDDGACPLCGSGDHAAPVTTAVVDPAADPAELREAAAGALEAHAEAPGSLAEALPDAPAAWSPAGEEQVAEAREVATVPLAIAVLSVLAMVLLWAFGRDQREVPTFDLAETEAVAAALPTTVPAGWVAHSDPSGGWFGRFPATPVARDDLAPDGTPVHLAEATTSSGATYRVSWDELATAPAAAEVAGLVEATLAGSVPIGSTLAAIEHPGGDPAVATAAFTTADGLAGQTRVALRGARRYRVVAFGPADELASTWPRVVGDFVAA